MAFYNQVKSGKWVETRQKIRDKTISKLSTVISNRDADKWLDYKRVQNKFMKIVESALNNAIDENGNVMHDLPTEDVRKLSASFKELTQNKSFLEGGPTEIHENRNIHLDIVKAINEVEKEDE